MIPENTMNLYRYGITLLIGLLLISPCAALEPGEVFLLVNKNVPESKAVAEHYCQKRKVPTDHILAFDLPAGEDISRQDYNIKLVEPLRKVLKDKKDKAKVLLSIYGVPLRVGTQDPTAEEKAELAKINPQIAGFQEQIQKLQKEIESLEAKVKDKPKGPEADQLQEKRKERDALQGKSKPLEARRNHLSYAESQACVDSELSQLWWEPYELRRWQVNLLYFQVPDNARKNKPVVMISRLDGPTPAIAKGLVDKAMEAEVKGLIGKVYVDARGIKYDPKSGDTGHGYGGYDESLREMAGLLEKAKLPVVLDDKGELFKPGSCPECALYCGWYSLANYVDCCKFVPGAVAYHIASSEAVSLRNPGTKLWCKCMLENGVTATLGPVAEPYTIGFPKPAEFFGCLVTGKYTLVECYYRTALLSSWMTVLVGDPLYNPFGKKPVLEEDKVKPSPAGGRFIFKAK